MIMDNKNRIQLVTHTDFSIEHILNRAGTSGINQNNHQQSQDLLLEPNELEFRNTNSNFGDTYSWLQCTRYCPPKVPRVQRREGPQKRQLGRHPRIPFTSHQLSLLEEKFRKSPYLSSEEVIILSKKLQLADIRVKIWFQNRRARERREKSITPQQKLTDSVNQDRNNVEGQLVSMKPSETNNLLANTTSTITSTTLMTTNYLSPVPFQHFIINSHQPTNTTKNTSQEQDQNTTET